MLKNVLFVFLLAVLAGCSSEPTMKSLAEDSAAAEQVRAEANAERAKQEQVRMETNLAGVPKWFLEVPKPDSTGVYAVGDGESKTLRVAMKKAMLDAEFGLAKVYGQELSGSERSIVQDGGGYSSKQYTELIDKLVGQVPVVGFETVHQEVKTIDGQYHVYVLLKLPHEQFNTVLQSQAAKAHSANEAEQFKELERRLDKRRQQAVKPIPASPVSSIDATPKTANPDQSESVSDAGDAADVGFVDGTVAKAQSLVSSAVQ